VDGLLKDYYLSPRYVPVALRQVLRRQGMDEMRRLLYSVRMFLGYARSRR